MMTKKDKKSNRNSQAAALLDDAPMAVYVSDAENNELLYANRQAKKLLFTEPYGPGRTGGKLIDWDGRPAYIEYITDTKETQNKENRTKTISDELQETFRSIPCGFCVYRIDGGGHIFPIFHNPAFYEIMGFSAEHIRSVEKKTDFLGVHAGDLEMLQKILRDALKNNGNFSHTYRVWNDRRREYHWIHLEGAIWSQKAGVKLLYGVYSDVSGKQRLEAELTAANEKMQDIINAIPGGVAIYKVTDIFRTEYFSDGVPELTGYTVEEYRELVKQDAAQMIYQEDRAMVTEKVKELVESRGISTFEFRKKHRNGSIVWVRVRVKWIGEEDGCPMLHCVFYNISDSKEAQLEMEHLINSIPGGIASYRIEGGKFIPTFYTDGVLALSGHTREEFEDLIRKDALDIIYEADRNRVMAAIKTAVKNGDVLDVSYRMWHKNGNLIWIHLNGRRMGPLAETMKFYAVFTGMSAEAQLFQSIANDTADGIYVIDKNNYDLLYANESKELFRATAGNCGEKCHMALLGKNAPCDFCTLKTHEPDGKAHEMVIESSGRFYSTSFRETNWNGIPAYVKFVQDVTEKVRTRKEKERLEQYFETLIKNLPGGVAVICRKKDGSMFLEFLSEGFAKMTDMTLEEVWKLYGQDIMAGVHPDDIMQLGQCLEDFRGAGEGHREIIYRIRKGKAGYLWVKNTISIIRSEEGEDRIYANFHDITKEREEQSQLRRQYKEQIIRHYRTQGPDVLMLGHCNVTKNQIYEMNDQTGSDLIETFSSDREKFFTGIAGLIIDEKEREKFKLSYMNESSLAAFERGETKLIQECFIRLPKEEQGRYARFMVNLVEEPDTGDITGILTVTDITDKVIEEQILRRISISNYDFVVDVDLNRDSFRVLAGKQDAIADIVENSYSGQVDFMAHSAVVPKDRKDYEKAMNPVKMRRKLSETESYTFFFTMTDQNGDVRTKNMTVTAVDLRIGRACIARTDITESVREQQSLLNVVAYTFEMLAFIRLETGLLTMHTRQTILENLSPTIIEVYDEDSVGRVTEPFGQGEKREKIVKQFRLKTMLERLKDKPAGYDFVVPYRMEDELRYKQINVLWGDETHTTLCIVRADVTDMLAAERQTKDALEKALARAEEASQAKSNFLSAMSHDIRTPMNAIIGMTTLAMARLQEPERLEDCLQKISYSSNHLLSLINDILDMSKIERSKVTLSREVISLPELAGQLSDMMAPQAEAAGIHFTADAADILHPYFYGDDLRINQILINILGNAIKFTPKGGTVEFNVRELHTGSAGTVCYGFVISDTGIGMPESFLAHIFEPFARSSKTAHVEGTGLGLSITKGLVDLMEGEITVASKLGEGTVFRVRLEFDIASAEESQTAEAREKTLALPDERAVGGRHFLVVEDNAINSEILCELLRMYGASFEVRTDGEQAVKVFQDSLPGTFDAILMDIQMPVMNGYEATRVIRSLEREDAGKIPIIAMTANAFAEDVQIALESGMNAHVAKPIDVPKFLAALNQVLGGTEG